MKPIHELIKYNPTPAQVRAEWTNTKEVHAAKAAPVKFGKKAAK